MDAVLGGMVYSVLAQSSHSMKFWGSNWGLSLHSLHVLLCMGFLQANHFPPTGNARTCKLAELATLNYILCECERLFFFVLAL